MIRRLALAVTSLIQKWNDAKSDPESGQLTYRAWSPSRRPASGLYSAHYVEQSVWLTPTQYALGFSVEQVDWLPGGYDGRRGLTLNVGPLVFGIDLVQPLRPAPKRVAR